MARLPDYTALGQAPVPQRSGGVASSEPVDFRAAGAALGGVGRQLEEAANIVYETNQRQDQMNAVAAVNTLQARRIDLEDGKAGFRQVRGAGAVGQQFLESYQQRFDEQASGIEQALENDNQRRIFQQRMAGARLEFHANLLKHQAAETDKFNDQTESDSVELARRQIFQDPTNPSALQSGIAQIDWAIEQRAQRMGWAPAVIAETKQKYHEKVFEDSAALLVERDPAGSLAAMNKRMGIGGPADNSGIPAFDAIDVKKLVELRHRASSYVTQAQNRLDADNDRRQKEAEQATKSLQEFALSGQMVDPEYEKQILSAVAGTQFEPMARTMIAASYMGAFHGSKTLPAQQQALQQMDAFLAQKGSSPEENKFAQRMREITATQAAAYKENPWAAATRFGKQDETPVQQIASVEQVPKLVAQRLAGITGVETYAGGPVSPLQPQEAKDFAEKLQALPPEARAEVIAQTGAMLSVPRAEALAMQLDQHDKPLALALKMGMDRTTAGRAASTLVLRGAQALADKTVKKDDQALAGWRAEIAGLVRGSIGNDKAESDVIDAAYYVRAAQDQEGIAPSGFKSSGSGAADAVAMVIGQPLDRAGVKTVLPRGMKVSDFDAKLRSYTPEKLTELGAPSGTEVQREAGHHQATFYVRGVPVPAAQIASHLPEYGMRLDPRTKRYTPLVRGAFVTIDPAGTQPLQLEVR